VIKKERFRALFGSVLKGLGVHRPKKLENLLLENASVRCFVGGKNLHFVTAPPFRRTP